MKGKREVFVKVLEKVKLVLLISGLSMILACQSWSQIWVSGLGRDNADPSHLLGPRVIEKYLLQSFNGLCNRPLFFNAHGLQVVIHLQHCYVALACCHLVPTYLSYFVLNGEFNHQVIVKVTAFHELRVGWPSMAL